MNTIIVAVVPFVIAVMFVVFVAVIVAAVVTVDAVLVVDVVFVLVVVYMCRQMAQSKPLVVQYDLADFIIVCDAEDPPAVPDFNRA